MAKNGALEPERRCVVTRAALPPDAMIRFVLAPDGTVAPDFKRRLPGRGAWVTATHAGVSAAVKRNAFAKSFRTAARAPPDLADKVEEELLRRALDALSLANKAGRAVAGFAKVDKALREGGVALLLHAAEAGADGARRLDALSKGLGYEIPSLRLFSGERMDLALGRSHVIHAALKTGDVTRLLMERADALGRYRK